jgi:hypothetical protein
LPQGMFLSIKLVAFCKISSSLARNWLLATRYVPVYQTSWWPRLLYSSVDGPRLLSALVIGTGLLCSPVDADPDFSVLLWMDPDFSAALLMDPSFTAVRCSVINPQLHLRFYKCTHTYYGIAISC